MVNVAHDGDYRWSGDYPGYAQSYLEEQYEGIQAMFWAGCGADINPLPRRKVELAQKYGKELSQAVVSGLAGVLDTVDPTLETGAGQNSSLSSQR